MHGHTDTHARTHTHTHTENKASIKVDICIYLKCINTSIVYGLGAEIGVGTRYIGQFQCPKDDVSLDTL